MKTLEKFKANSPPKRRVPKLDKIKEEIIDLYQSGYQAEQIQEFAILEKIDVSVRTVKRYLSKLKASKFSLTNPKSAAKPPEIKNGKKSNPFLDKIIKQAQE